MCPFGPPYLGPRALLHVGCTRPALQPLPRQPRREHRLRTPSDDRTADLITDAWYSEIADYPQDYSQGCFSCGAGGRAVGHFTQVVWQASIRLGCGVKRDCPAPGQPYGQVVWVCQYGPMGNFGGTSEWPVNVLGPPPVLPCSLPGANDPRPPPPLPPPPVVCACASVTMANGPGFLMSDPVFNWRPDIAQIGSRPVYSTAGNSPTYLVRYELQHLGARRHGRRPDAVVRVLKPPGAVELHTSLLSRGHRRTRQLPQLRI